MWNLRVRYSSDVELRHDLSQQLSHGGLLVRVAPAEGMSLGDPVTLELVTPAGDAVRGEGQVLNVMPGHGVAISFGPAQVARVSALVQATRVHHFDAAPAVHEWLADTPTPAAPPPAAGDNASRVAPRAPASAPSRPPTPPRAPATVREPPAPSPGATPSAHAAPSPAPGSPLPSAPAEPSPAPDDAAGAAPGDEPSTADKIRVALHGSRDERAAILRDRNRALHPYVLKNPHVTIDEVLAIAKNPQMSPEVLKQIADRKDWLGRPGVAQALARNPKTPPEVGVRALDLVPPEGLRQMAKGIGALPHIAQAARKKVLGGG